MTEIVLQTPNPISVRSSPRTTRLDLARNIVPFVVIRFLLLPVLTYTYLRVGTDIVTGNRDWRK
jgi:hypothetical protein